ncbi:MAG: hypothetical protein JNK15_06985 [Planctomycetes bacterium]|nr:hypothetical protein [Planctomycetota bacterium]
MSLFLVSLLAAACAMSPEATRDLSPLQQWEEAEAAEQAGDLARAQQIYEVVCADDCFPVAAWRSAALVARLRAATPGLTFAESEDAGRLVPRVLALAIEGDVDTARQGIELLRDRLDETHSRRGLATLLLGDLDMRAGDHAAAATKFGSIVTELQMDEYRDGGRWPTECVVWAALRHMEAAVLLDDWLTARRRLGLVEAWNFGVVADRFVNSELQQRVRDMFPQWLERVTDPAEKRVGVRRQLASRPFVDGVVERLGEGSVAVESGRKLREFELLLTNGDVLSGVVEEGASLDPATYVGHGRIDRHDGGIAFGLLDHGRLREGVAIAPLGTFDVVDDFVVQNSVVLRGDKLRGRGSISRDALRVFRTMYPDDSVAIDYFDRRTGRNLQFQWKDRSIVSVLNKPLQALSDQDRAAEIAAEEHYRRYGSVESDDDRAAREWRERNGARAFQFNVDEEDHTCIKCRGVGSLWRGGFVQQNVWVWQEGLNPSDSRLRNVTLHQSGGMETCTWCNGTGRR